MLQVVFSHVNGIFEYCPINVSVSGWEDTNAVQWFVLLSHLMYQFLVGTYKCCKLFFPCSAMVYSNIIPINVNFVTIHETGSSSGKIIKRFRGKESLKHQVRSTDIL